jgi:hypothetical protein
VAYVYASLHSLSPSRLTGQRGLTDGHHDAILRRQTSSAQSFLMSNKSEDSSGLEKPAWWTCPATPVTTRLNPTRLVAALAFSFFPLDPRDLHRACHPFPSHSWDRSDNHTPALSLTVPTFLLFEHSPAVSIAGNARHAGCRYKALAGPHWPFIYPSPPPQQTHESSCHSSVTQGAPSLRLPSLHSLQTSSPIL